MASQLRSDVAQIFSTSHAFAALKTDGSVVSWGNRGSVGDSSAVASQLRSGVTQIFSTSDAFAALKEDGSVITWGGWLIFFVPAERSHKHGKGVQSRSHVSDLARFFSVVVPHA